MASAALMLALSVSAHADEDAVQIGPGIEPPKCLLKTAVRYPATANEQGVGGIVVVKAVIDRKGRVKQAQVVSTPDKRLGKAAVDAMTMREYSPATRDGVPIAVWHEETFEFFQAREEALRILACDPAKVEVGDPSAGGAVVYPELIRNVDPPVTDEMRLEREPGRVKLACVIDVCGRVGECEVLQSSGVEFTKSAIASAQQRLYRPATLNGKPVAMTMTIRIDFNFR